MMHKKIRSELLRFLGISAIILSMILIASSGVLTGNVIIEKVLSDNFKILGIIIFVGGAVMLAMAGRDEEREGEGLEERVEILPDLHVFTTHKKGANSTFNADRDCGITDPSDYFGRRPTSLGEFKIRVRELKEGNSLDIVQADYGPTLRRIAKSKTPESIIAKYFLRALEMPIPEEGITILISKKALERARKDSTIRGNWDKFKDEIEMISKSPQGRPKERIGEFLVSPRGANGRTAPRIVWDYDSRTDTLRIFDVLYHVGMDRYVDNWNQRVTEGKIKKDDYERAGFKDYTGRIN